MDDTDDDHDAIKNIAPPHKDSETLEATLLAQLFFASFMLGLAKTGTICAKEIPDELMPMVQTGAATLAGKPIGSPQVALATSNIELFGTRLGLHAAQQGSPTATADMFIAVKSWICPLFPFC